MTTVPAWGSTRTPGSKTSSSTGIRTLARILPSGPSSAVPTLPRPRIRPSVAPFCLSKSGTAAAWLIGPPRDALIGRRRAYTGGVVSHNAPRTPGKGGDIRSDDFRKFRSFAGTPFPDSTHDDAAVDVDGLARHECGV